MIRFNKYSVKMTKTNFGNREYYFVCSLKSTIFARGKSYTTKSYKTHPRSEGNKVRQL